MEYSEDHIALAAEYALGTLDADERAQVETMMSVDPDFIAVVQAWEFRLGVLNQMVGSVEPPTGIVGADQDRDRSYGRAAGAAGVAGAATDRAGVCRDRGGDGCDRGGGTGSRLHDVSASRCRRNECGSAGRAACAPIATSPWR